MASLLPHQSAAHLGRGFAYPIGVTAQGNLQISDGEQSVRESILLILRTRPGERLRRPNFGCRLHELAFAPMNQKTLVEMRLFVEEALKTWERRIWLDDVGIDPQLELGQVDITIAYRLITSHVPGSLVYPFYLQPLGETAGA
ncbi:MAG: GPW/gp25 family protein [Cyanobacteria bacterium P01_C01_bin.120]